MTEAHDLSYEEEENPRDKLCNIEAEQMVLGCILMNNEALYAAERVLGAEDFSEGLHQRIYDRCVKMIESGSTASPLTLGNYFANDPAMQEIGSGYLATLAAVGTSPRLVMDYANIVRRASQMRTLYDSGNEMIRLALHSNGDDTPEEILDDIQSRLDPVTSKDTRGGSVSLADASNEAMQEIERAHQNEGTTGIPTGLQCVDNHMGGFEPTDLIIIAGRPGMGKTALATNIAVNMAKTGKKVLFFSMEMAASQLAMRIMSAETNISTQLLRKGHFKSDTYRRIREARDTIKDLPLEIDERGALTIHQLAGKARRVKRKQGLDAIVVDYIQLMQGSGRQDNRVQIITEITSSLKALAKELNVPLIALSQLSRKVEDRPNKRPMLSDLRESGSIEQDADVILFPFREEYYLRMEGKKEDTCEALRLVAGQAELMLAKWRHGPTRDFELQFNSITTTFSDGGGL